MRIDIEALSVRYGRHPAVQDLTLSAGPGQILGVLGPNGSGKSSFVKAIAGVVPYGGQIRFDGQPQRPAAIGYMPQDHNVRAALTVLETVLLGRLGRLGLRVADADLAAVEQVLEDVGIPGLAMRDLGALSGGQRQLVFLAQALAAEPRALLLDEPFSALDIRHQLEVAALLRRLTRARSLTTILVLHDFGMAARLADRIILLGQGRLLAEGDTASVLASPVLHEAFQVAFDTVSGLDGRLEIRGLRLL